MEAAFSRFEMRDGQRKMMEEVDHCFHQFQHALIEAGTGTGKSLAYFLPSAFYAIECGNPVVISTQTIPLQDQLLTRDLPLLEQMLPFSLRVAVLKGRSHYLCLRKFEQSLLSIENDTYDVILAKAQILIWITETETGDVEELNLPSGGRSFWYDVQSDSVSDIGRYSPWFSRCYYHRAKRRALEAHVIITNHALLFTDLVQNQQLLPSYSHAVIDEAHHFETAASDHLGIKTDYITFSYLWQRIGVTREDGMLGHLHRMLSKFDLQRDVNFERIEQRLSAAKDETDELFRMLHSYVYKKKQSDGDRCWSNSLPLRKLSGKRSALAGCT